VGAGSGEVRKGALKRELMKRDTSPGSLPLFRGRCLDNGKKITFSYSGK
jgi:hypothetical protein